MAEILKKDPATYQRERDSFIRDLKHFHEARGTPVRRLPFMNGKELDLYLLYLLVTAKGGWVKVNQRNEWGAVLNQFESLNHCVNGEVALKQIYLRYLDRYEKINFLGETCERTVEEDEEGRHKRFSARISTNPVPHQYNYHQHIVSDNVRANGKLSQNLYIPSEYDKLALSLISPLPNEQDFAINVCALLSGANNEGRNTSLKLCNHPRLMHYLLAHAAVYNHHTLRNLMEENYKEIRGYSLKYFWSDVLEDKELSILMDEKKHVKRRPKPSDKPNLNDTASASTDADENQKFNDDDVDCRLKLKPEDKELFCIGRSFGTQDFVGQRVLQIAMILRNATFMEENVPTLAGDSTFLRFVLLCCGSRWNCLHQLGFDMLSNVAQEVVLEDFLVDHLMRIICRGLESPDRTVILGCVETLNKLGQKEENEEIMLRCIEQKVYSRICSFLSLQDIMLLIHTLECLYSLSSLGEKACNSIVHVSGAIDSLISLVTVEAQSYGPKACILMRVVETVTGDPQEAENTSTFATPAAPAVSHSSGAATCATSTVSASVSSSSSFMLTSSAATTPLVTSVPSMVTNVSNANTPIVSVSSLLQASVLPTPAVASPVAMPVPQQPLQPASLPPPQQQSPQSQPIVRPSTPQRVVLPVTTTATFSTPTVQVTSTIVTSSTTVTPSVTLGSTGQHPSIVATQQENENFATQWLKNTFETHTQPGRGVEQNELYKLYMTACSRAGRRGVIAPKHFPQCVRTAFGNSVVLRELVPANSSGSSEASTSKLNMYEGLQVRAKPLNVTVAPSTLTQPARTPSSPILKAQLSSPSPPNITKKEVKSKVSSSHPHLSNVLLNAGSNTTSTLPTLKPSMQSQTTVALTTTTNDSSNSTSLIKSLLATKVGDFINTKPSVTVKNEKSVLPTPHQLVLNTAIAGQTIKKVIIKMTKAALPEQNRSPKEMKKAKAIKLDIARQNCNVVRSLRFNNNSHLDRSGDSVLMSQWVAQRQQQQQLQQHKIVTQPHLQTISSSGETSNIHILPQTTDISKQIVQLTQAGLQVIQASQPPEQKPQIIQLTPATQQQLLQVPSSDKPQLVQISHPGGQQQLIQINAGQQQLLQICQQASQTATQPIIQVCPIKQEQSVQTSETMQPQQVLLSQSGQQQQMIQLTPQLLPHLTPSVQQQILQASQITQTRPVLAQQLLQDQGTQSIGQQTLPLSDSGQQVGIVPQSMKQCQTAGTQVTQSNQVVMVPAAPKSDHVVQSSTVSVITSTASANMKPLVSRINGMRSFTPVNVVVDDDKIDLTASLLTDEKMESSPELPFSSNSNDSSDIPKQQAMTQPGSKVIVENHLGTSGTSSTLMINNKGSKLNDLEAELSESSSNQSLPVISIKDTESNLPACELGSEDSTGMFEDFLLNGKSNSTLDDSIANNLMSEDSLLNNIIMREEMVNNINLPESTTTDNLIKIGNVENNGTSAPSNQNSKENNFVLGDTNAMKQEINFVTQSNSFKTEGSLPVTENVEIQTKTSNNFTNLLRSDLAKADEKNITTKNLMLAELLEKSTEKKEPPILNGALRLGEKGLELIRKEEIQSNFKPTFNEKSVICSNKKNFVTKNSVDVLPKPEIVITDSKPELITSAAASQRIIGIKRMNDQEVQCDTEVKKPHLNGDTTIKLNPGEEETHDENNVKASSSAANLYAALAADVLGDIDGMEEEETPVPVPTTSSITTFPAVTAVAPSTPTVVESPSQQLYLTPGHNPRQQILLTTSQAGMGPRVSIMNAGGQQYIVTPQTAIVQGQPQTVFVTQTAQQHGTGAKTIIILQSQNPSGLTSQAVTTNPQPKVIMQKVSGSSPPVMSVTSSSVVVSTSLPSTIKTAQPTAKLLQTNTQSQGTQISATQFIPTQSIVSASSQTLPVATNQLANIFPKNGNVSQTQTTISAQCNAAAQTTIVTQVPQVSQVVTQVSNFVSPQTVTQTVATNMANSISQVQTQSSQCRQVKVIKTVPHLQPVTPNKLQSVTQQSLVTTPVATTSVVPVATAPAITAIAVTTVSTTTVSTPSVPTTPVKPTDQGQFLCEWRSCMRSFKTANEVYLHACAAHCPSGSQEIQCLWERCDAMKRKRFSLMTHLYDRHCNPEILKMMAVRRKQIYQSGRSEIPPPLPPTPHPGYAPNAALHAIKRHALEFVNPKELQDENEGPVTKSIRLTSSLILRNVVIYSTSGRRHLTSYEPHLASIALSNVESSRTIAQILFDMNDHNR